MLQTDEYDKIHKSAVGKFFYLQQKLQQLK